jgi:AhpC/TSA antioxidant enzyme
MNTYLFDRRLYPGTVIARRELAAIDGTQVRVPDPTDLVHLQFRRFAGCPLCNLHLRSIVNRQAEIRSAGIREVVVFHSAKARLLPHAAELPFAVIADPGRRLFGEFRVESSPRALLSPRAWLPILRSISLSAWNIVFRRAAIPSINPDGGRWGLPAEFLIAPDGAIVAAKYGAHAYDQWSVDDLLQVAQARNEAHLGIVRLREKAG